MGLLGARVLVRIGGEDAMPVLRPADITHVWSEVPDDGSGCVNLQVMLDPLDGKIEDKIPGTVIYGSAGKVRVPILAIITSAIRGKAVGDWRPIR